MFGVPSGEFDRQACLMIRALKITHSAGAAHQGAIHPQKGKNSSLL